MAVAFPCPTLDAIHRRPSFHLPLAGRASLATVDAVNCGGRTVTQSGDLRFSFPTGPRAPFDRDGSHASGSGQDADSRFHSGSLFLHLRPTPENMSHDGRRYSVEPSPVIACVVRFHGSQTAIGDGFCFTPRTASSPDVPRQS